jgi:hypothetical protein
MFLDGYKIIFVRRREFGTVGLRYFFQKTTLKIEESEDLFGGKWNSVYLNFVGCGRFKSQLLRGDIWVSCKGVALNASMNEVKHEFFDA